TTRCSNAGRAAWNSRTDGDPEPHGVSVHSLAGEAEPASQHRLWHHLLDHHGTCGCAQHLGVLPVLRCRGDCAHAVGRLVCMDVAQATRSSSAIVRALAPRSSSFGLTARTMRMPCLWKYEQPC